jgi:hypothetical protein
MASANETVTPQQAFYGYSMCVQRALAILRHLDEGEQNRGMIPRDCAQ